MPYPFILLTKIRKEKGMRENRMWKDEGGERESWGEGEGERERGRKRVRERGGGDKEREREREREREIY